MLQINGYFTFNGNCREAMQFYQQCLGGELQLQTIGDSPLATKMPATMRDCILHATLSGSKFTLMASDMVGEEGVISGNSTSLVLNCSSQQEIETLHLQLSAGGNVNHAIETSFWGALFGTVTDKYQHQWLLHFQP